MGRAISGSDRVPLRREAPSAETLVVRQTTTHDEGGTQCEPQQYVGIDFHRSRSVIVRKNEAGETLETVHIDNEALAFAAEIAKAGEHPEVVLEATYG